MFKKLLLAMVLVVALCHFCGEDAPAVEEPEELLGIEDYIEGLSEGQTGT